MKPILFWLFLFILVQHCNLPYDTGKQIEIARLDYLLEALDTLSWQNPETGHRYASEAIQIAVMTNDSLRLAQALLKKAGCFQTQDVSDSALIFFKQGLKVAESIRKDSLVAKIKNGIANFYLRREDYPEAMKYLTDALTISERVGYKHVMGLVYNGLGLVCISMKEYDKAIDYFSNAKIICRETGDLPNEAGINMNIAGCYAELGEYSMAYQFYLDNLDAQLKLNDTAQIVLAHINLGIISRTMGNLNVSLQQLGKARTFLQNYPNQSLESTTLLELGTTHLVAGNGEKARKLLLESLQFSSGTLAKSNSMEALARLSELEEKNGNPKLSLEYFKRFTMIKDSVMNDETRRSVEEIQWKYDLQKKEYENELLSKKIEIKQRQNNNLRIIFGSFILVAILTGVLIWLAYKNLRNSFKLKASENARLQEKIDADERINQLEKLRLQTEIDSKNRELTSTSLQLITKNKLLADIGEMTGSFYSSGQIDKPSYHGLQRLIRENLNLDKDWEQFKEVFEKVHENFFVILKTNFPDLTEHEMRLCAYIRINLRNKEIARMLNVSPATVNTSRYRVRKKLDLDNKTSLEDFVRSI